METIILVALSALAGTTIGLIICTIAFINIYKSLVSNYVITQETIDRMEIMDKKITFILDCLECIEGNSINYDKFREIQNYREKLNMK